MVNLVVKQELLDDEMGILNVNGKSHVLYHVLTIRNFNAPKKLYFWQNREEIFN